MKKTWCYFVIGNSKVKIDTEDFDRVSQLTWRIRRRIDAEKLSIYTTVRSLKKNSNVSLGKFLMDPPNGKLVYPRRYFDGFDYRKENLIVCTMQERQQMLPKKRKDKSSNYRGVSFSKRDKQWRASITLDGRLKNLGNFKTETAAAMAYNRASAEFAGKNGYQNTISRAKNRRE